MSKDPEEIMHLGGISPNEFEPEEKELPDVKGILFEDEDDGLNFEDGRKSKLEYQRLQIIDSSTALIAFVGAAVTVIAVSNQGYSEFQ